MPQFPPAGDEQSQHPPTTRWRSVDERTVCVAGDTDSRTHAKFQVNQSRREILLTLNIQIVTLAQIQFFQAFYLPSAFLTFRFCIFRPFFCIHEDPTSLK